MSDTALESVLRRDRAIVAVALAILTACAWAYIVWLAGTMEMSGMNMPVTEMDSMAAPALQPWGTVEFLFMFFMWAVMMVGMMTPSAAPMILIYARVGRDAARKGKPLAATGFFAGGYLLAWSVFSLFATTGQWAFENALLLAPAMTSANDIVSAFVLIAAGVYQWTPLKEACLANCQAPLFFIQRHGGFRRDAFGSLRVGFVHGLYCIGCCWALMALLFVGGVMNLLWIAAIAIFVLAEKIIPAGRLLSRVAGSALIIAGGWLLIANAP